MGKKANVRLQPDAIARVPRLKCRCRPQRNCLARIDLEEVRKCRQEYWRNLATEREKMSWLACVRQHRETSSWNINGKFICTEAWLKLYGISFGKFAKARQVLLADGAQPSQERRLRHLVHELAPARQVVQQALEEVHADAVHIRDREADPEPEQVPEPSPSKCNKRRFARKPKRWLGFPEQREEL